MKLGLFKTGLFKFWKFEFHQSKCILQVSSLPQTWESSGIFIEMFTLDADSNIHKKLLFAYLAISLA